MEDKELEDLGTDFATQCAVSYTKMAWRDEEDFNTLRRIILTEFKAVILPYLITKEK